MDTYQLKLDIYFLNVIIYGDLSLEEGSQSTQSVYQDLARFGVSGTITIGTSLSSLSVMAKNTESDDPETLTAVEVIVDEDAERRDDASFEKVMPLRSECLGTTQVAESDLLPIVNDEDVFVPVPWGGPSTVQFVAPDGFDRDVENNVVVKSLLVVVSPEIPQP